MKTASGLQAKDDWQKLYKQEEMVKIIQRKNQLDQNVFISNVVRIYQKKWGYEDCYKYATLSEFDYIIRKMIDILKKVPEKILEKAFYNILIPMGNLQKSAFDKIN